MDVISSSCININPEKISDANKFQEIITSTTSLSNFDSKRFKTLLPQIIASLIAASFNIVYGISLAYSAILLPQLTEESKNGTNPDALYATEDELSWIASVIVIVVPIGAIIGGFIMDSRGRLMLVKISVIPNTIGWILISVASNVSMLISGRILTGIGAAWSTGPAIVYMTEIARADMRGSLISVAPAYASLGMVLAYLLGWFMHWRHVGWACVAFSSVPMLMMLFIPESPAWLISKGRNKQALKALKWINKYQSLTDDKPDRFTEVQYAILLKEHLKKQEEQALVGGNDVQKKFKMFIDPTCYKPLLILAGLFFFQQYSGTYITLFYAVSFFKDVGTNINPYLASIFLGLVRFAMSIVNTWLMKRFERRTLMLASVIGMSSCMCISGLFTKWIHDGTTEQGWIPVAMLVIYVMTSMVGLLSIPWTIIAELFPIAIRGVAHSIVYSIANLIMFSAIQFYYKLNRFFGGSAGLQFFFAVISLGGLVYSYIFLPETHGKKLSEIEDYFKTNCIYLSRKKKKIEPIVKNDLNGESEKEKMMKNEIC